MPGMAVLEGLTELCRDPSNVVFVVSGRGKDELQQAFGHIQVQYNNSTYMLLLEETAVRCGTVDCRTSRYGCLS